MRLVRHKNITSCEIADKRQHSQLVVRLLYSKSLRIKSVLLRIERVTKSFTSVANTTPTAQLLHVVLGLSIKPGRLEA